MTESRSEPLIINKRGLHARAAAKFVKTAENFSSHITVTKDGYEVDARSLMGLLLLGAASGCRIGILAQGDDSADAVKALVALIDDRFGEGE